MRPHRLIALSAVLVTAGVNLLTGCGHSSAPDGEFAAYVHHHPLTAGSLVNTKVVVDDDCDCNTLQVTLSLDHADQVTTNPDLIAKNMADVMEDVCAFKPSSHVRTRYMIEKLGPWRKVDASLVVGAENGLSPRCDHPYIEQAANAVATSVSSLATVPGAAPAGWRNDFTTYSVDRRSSAPAAAKALSVLAKYATPSLRVQDGMMDVTLNDKTLASPQLVAQFSTLMKTLPEGTRIRTVEGGLSCNDCGGLPKVPQPALILSIDNPSDQIQLWATTSHVDTTPHDGRILLVPATDTATGALTYTRDQLQQAN